MMKAIAMTLLLNLATAQAVDAFGINGATLAAAAKLNDIPPLDLEIKDPATDDAAAAAAASDATVPDTPEAAALNIDFNKLNLGIIQPISLRFTYRDLVKTINLDTTTTWTAKLARGITYTDLGLQSLLGALIDLEDTSIVSETDNLASAGRRLQSMPLSYDLRKAYSNCWSVNYIRHQGQCGSCWAVAGATALSDRYCIQKSSIFTTYKRSFSYEDLLECCSASVCGTGPNKGCNGGYIAGAYKYARDNGLVTGEQYGATTMCKNYFLAPTAPAAPAPSCRSYCTTRGYTGVYAREKRKISRYAVYSTPSRSSASVAAAAMEAILKRGTVTAYLAVYNDFFTYSSGVYVKKAGAVYKGGHAVRLLGWGYDPYKGHYWIGANSWGSGWGINGFFYIRKGANECKIESYIVEGFL